MVQSARSALLFSKTPTVALSYLSEANKILVDANKPSLVDIRNALALDIERLNNVVDLDVADVVLQIETLSVELIKLATPPKNLITKDQKNAEKEKEILTKNWQRFWQRSKDLFSQAFIIRKHQQTKPTFLLSEEKYGLILSLQYKLQIASWAILHNQDRLYETNMAQTITTLQNHARYFSSELVDKILPSLQKLQGISAKKKIALPNLDTTLKAIEVASI